MIIIVVDVVVVVVVVHAKKHTCTQERVIEFPTTPATPTAGKVMHDPTPTDTKAQKIMKNEIKKDHPESETLLSISKSLQFPAIQIESYPSLICSSSR